ncbi:BglG family transcription antiterminator [Parageobacillus thermoglucosidasius]|uniref:Ascorbate-specific PTS system EIIA component n=1 Tax=Parageobacillus thermoglucosidasius TaxID=1426 RepID=A0AAN0YNF6_PARTM|nr:BglG family transcription antiterminator [Parageobacillus thermoglucosidasius]ALF10360.1 transcription antiterminator BglG [Parageobacillus thermoglucosidasius]ANZ30442.1 transcription antiterminator BglG [Parageobacillus thermoglucosidasius]APM81180.1 transcription antiterminator BglG [Parageobacillus thermoglucosidasius]KJX68585.1 transcription antiterminator BglG [Parageobacillus thermoglucosidasius]RDE21769.1 PRD domain-containing protein [Parageobacillus thermoglucosidasius]
MILDGRSIHLLREVIKNPNISSKELEKKYQLSRRQIGYSFEKINIWLRSKNMNEIERTNSGYFLVDKTLKSKLHLELNLDEEFGYENLNELSKMQRVNIILLMLLSKTEELSLVHFTSELKVSKNTVIDDLKQAKKLADGFNLELRYSRKYGYLIEGKEFNIRKLLISTIYKISKMDRGIERVRQIAQLSNEEIAEFRNRIEKVEKSLNLKFTDEKIEVMPYILLLILRRISQGMKMDSPCINYEGISDTKEYLATEEILRNFKDVPEEERLFITLHLLTTNVHWSEGLTEETIPDLIQALDEMLILFEKNTCIFLKDRDQLLQKLLLHMKPAYYRIKYNLTEVNEMYEIVKIVNHNFKELHHLVKKSIQTLVDLIGCDIPESEIVYLTMLIGGWLTRQGENISKRMKAVVVCPKGVSISRLMFSTLRELFPEFIFLDSLSIREFQEYPMDYDIVFAPVFLETPKKFFLVNSFLGYEEKKRLRKQVMHELYGYVPNELNVDGILEIIEKHCVIKDRKNLSKQLLEYISQDRSPELNYGFSTKNPDLYELITPSTITLRHSVSTWEEAIKIASRPLLKRNSITQHYIEAMIQRCHSDPYIVIGPKTAIPHAAPDEGVNELSMSLLRLRKGVTFATDYSIQLVIVIAALDKDRHLRALMQLMKLARNDHDRQQMINAKSVYEIHEIIKKYAADP